MVWQTGETGNPKAKKIWRDAIIRALERASKDKVDFLAIDECADGLLAACRNGEIPALRELGDRLDGKPAQAIIGGAEDDPPIRIKSEADQALIDRYLKQETT